MEYGRSFEDPRTYEGRPYRPSGEYRGIRVGHLAPCVSNLVAEVNRTTDRVGAAGFEPIPVRGSRRRPESISVLTCTDMGDPTTFVTPRRRLGAAV